MPFRQMSVGTMLLGLMMMMVTICITGCKDELDIQDNYPFELKVMPVPKSILYGETVEIRISILSKGDYSGNKYYIRYFQNEGKGMLRYFYDKPYQQNDLYPLSEKEFRLHYISQAGTSQNFDIWISDTFGNEKQLSFQFKTVKIEPVRDSF